MSLVISLVEVEEACKTAALNPRVLDSLTRLLPETKVRFASHQQSPASNRLHSRCGLALRRCAPLRKSELECRDRRKQGRSMSFPRVLDDS